VSGRAGVGGLLRDHQLLHDLAVRQTSSTDPTVVEVKFAYKPAYPLNYIVISFSIDMSTGDDHRHRQTTRPVRSLTDDDQQPAEGPRNFGSNFTTFRYAGHNIAYLEACATPASPGGPGTSSCSRWATLPGRDRGPPGPSTAAR
jgi:hypothetical protein